MSKALGGASPQTLVYVCAGAQVIAEYLAGTALGSAERKYLYASYISINTGACCCHVDKSSIRNSPAAAISSASALKKK